MAGQVGISVQRKSIIVKQNEWGDFEVPTQKDGTPLSIYYADDKEDAEDTAHYVHGHHVDVIHRRGTYGVEEK